MSEYNRYEAKYMLIRNGIGKILDSLDAKSMEEVDKRIEELDIDIDYLCEYPDVLCSILKIACGRSYVDLIRSVSEMEETRHLDSNGGTSPLGSEKL
ncbi:MAG TPA: hypothetical protein VJ792_08000 [Candidatus Nitrosotalea sp.]|nr:hypothetical protein [Candidatus Nitrosotalea sp.]